MKFFLSSVVRTHHREGKGSGADRQTERRRDGAVSAHQTRKNPVRPNLGQKSCCIASSGNGGLWRRSPLWRSRTRPRPGRRGTSCFTWAVAGRRGTERRMSKSCYFPRAPIVAPGTDFTVRAHLSPVLLCGHSVDTHGYVGGQAFIFSSMHRCTSELSSTFKNQRYANVYIKTERGGLEFLAMLPRVAPLLH